MFEQLDEPAADHLPAPQDGHNEVEPYSTVCDALYVPPSQLLSVELFAVPTYLPPDTLIIQPLSVLAAAPSS